MFFISTRSSSTKAGLRGGLVLILALCIPAAGQVMQTGRFEVPINSRNEYFDIVPSSESGLFLHRHLAGIKEDQIHLIRLDTAFHEKWSGFIAVQRNYRIMGTKAFDDKLFMLLRYRDYSKNDLILYRISAANGGYIQYSIKSYIPFAPTEFQITDDAAIIGGYYNRIPVVLHYSFTQQRSKVLPGLFSEAGELTQVKTHADGSFDVLISAKNLARQRTIWIKSYDPEGSLLRNLPLEPDENKHLIFGRSLKTDGDKQIVAGVYGNKSAEFSRGLFIATIDPSGAAFR